MRRLVLPLVVGAALAIAPAAGAVSGQLRALVLQATWGPEPLGPGQAQAVLDGAARFLGAASFGQLQLTGDVTPWLHVFSSPPPCESTQPLEAVRAAAAAAGFDPRAYQRRIYLLPYDEGTCPTGGPFAFAFSREVFDVGLFTAPAVAHELGHTFGLGHARRRVCRASCSDEEYGDPIDAMATGTGDFNPLEKSIAGWLPQPAVAASEGDYVIDQFELPGALPQELVVSTARGDYWIDHREPLGNDSGLAAGGGIEVRLRAKPLLGSGLILTPSLLVCNPGEKDPAEESYTLPGVFSVTVLRHVDSHVDVRFRWLDRVAPGQPTPRAPARTSGAVPVQWHPSVDRASGVARYELRLDGRLAATTSALRTTLAVGTGRHSLSLVAVDRAGNRSRAGTRRFVAR